MSIESLRQYAVLDGEQLEQLWQAYDVQTQAANDGCDAARNRFDQLVALRSEIERLKQRDRDYRDATSGCPDVLISRELLTKSFDKLYCEKSLRERVAELEGLCRQLYEAERDKNQKDWTAVIQALEKVGADNTALVGSNSK